MLLQIVEVSVRTQLCATFHKLIRHINNAFSLCSLGSTKPKGHYQNATTGAYTFASRGQLYHNISSLQPDLGQKPVFAQLYIYNRDEDQGALSEQHQARSHAFEDIPPGIMSSVHNLMQEHHPYVRAFKINSLRILKTRPCTSNSISWMTKATIPAATINPLRARL